MPTSGLLACSIEIGDSTTRLREYGTTYHDRTVETYVAIPSKATPFSIRVKSTGYIAPGLAVYVYIDSVYQTNRNKRGATRESGELEFHLGQKEDLLRDGRVIARGWWFENLNIVEGKTKPTINEEVLDNLGVIEVVILRCEDDPASIPKNPWTFPILPSIPPKGKMNPSAGTAAKQLKRTTRAPSPEADDNGNDAFGGMFGLFDGAGDEPPRSSCHRFGGLDGHYDIPGWSASVAPHSPSRKYKYSQRDGDLEDDATRTSSANSNGYYHMPRAFNSGDSIAATHGVEQDNSEQYRSHTVYVHSKENNHKEFYRHTEPRQTRMVSSPELHERREKAKERLPNSPHLGRTALRFDSPPRYDRKGDDDRRVGQPVEHVKSFGAPERRRRKKKIVEIEVADDDIDCHQEKPVLQGRREYDERHGYHYIARGREQDGESPDAPPRGNSQHEHELRYPAVNIPPPYGQTNTSYESKYLAARNAQRGESAPSTRLQPPPWQPSIPPPPSRPASFAEKERVGPFGINRIPDGSFSGPPLPAPQESWYRPSAPPPGSLIQVPSRPSSKARRAAMKIAKLEEQLHKLRAKSAPVPRYPSDWHPGTSITHGTGALYFEHPPFVPAWAGEHHPRTQHSSSKSSGTTRSAIDDTGGSMNQEAAADAVKTGPGTCNNTNNNNNNNNVENNNTQNGITNDWAEDNNNNNSGNAIQANNSTWETPSNQNDNTQQQSGWDANNNQSNDNNAGNSGDWGGAPAGDNQPQNGNNEWNNNQGDNNQDNDNQDNTNEDNGWDNQNDGQGKDSKPEKSKKGRRKRRDSSSSGKEEKPYTRSYWHAQAPKEKLRENANSGCKREIFSMPEDPIYTISKDEAEAKKLKHQVRGGRGTEKQNKLGTKPLYWDNLEAPYAVFRFKYRSKDMLKKILGEDIKESKEEYKEWLNALSKEQLVAEMLRNKEEGDSDSEGGDPDKKSDEQTLDSNGSWENQDKCAGATGWENSGGDGNNGAGDTGGGWGAGGGNEAPTPSGGW